jgi:hypothetical protein
LQSALTVATALDTDEELTITVTCDVVVLVEVISVVVMFALGVMLATLDVETGALTDAVPVTLDVGAEDDVESGTDVLTSLEVVPVAAALLVVPGV